MAANRKIKVDDENRENLNVNDVCNVDLVYKTVRQFYSSQLCGPDG